MTKIRHPLYRLAFLTRHLLYRLAFLTDAAREARTENLAYTELKEQDSLLCTWILSTISSSLLSRFVRLCHAWKVWEEVHLYCSTQMKTISRQLRYELCNISKGL